MFTAIGKFRNRKFETGRFAIVGENTNLRALDVRVIAFYSYKDLRIHSDLSITGWGYESFFEANPYVVSGKIIPADNSGFLSDKRQMIFDIRLSYQSSTMIDFKPYQGVQYFDLLENPRCFPGYRYNTYTKNCDLRTKFFVLENCIETNEWRDKC